MSQIPAVSAQSPQTKQVHHCEKANAQVRVELIPHASCHYITVSVKSTPA
jgi:hypothetical protein